MTDLVVHTLFAGIPVNGLVDAPQITIQRTDTGAQVVTGAAMTDTGFNGLHTYDFTPVAGIGYSFIVDADPLISGQVDIRFSTGAFDNEINDLWNDHGLNPDIPKTIEENTPNSDLDEDVASPTPIHKDVTVAGSTTTITRT